MDIRSLAGIPDEIPLPVAIDIQCTIQSIDPRETRTKKRYFVVRAADVNNRLLIMTYWATDHEGLEVGREYIVTYQVNGDFKNLKLWEIVGKDTKVVL